MAANSNDELIDLQLSLAPSTKSPDFIINIENPHLHRHYITINKIDAAINKPYDSGRCYVIVEYKREREPKPTYPHKITVECTK